ncbi:hypothetical protein GLS40_09235 [Pseudooceanicola sp. 216_PA32_1]|jgi:acyl dehydratase|uniref:MaoC-like domain-containing protein n=1 Tax=Pseudooceanicola pacificus TaxID=2676438 RepID=A0A844W240_9RHOB|nr:MaoC family dehydratase [Pseudooceanicola pacificus]MWB78206.1 hypothetical protein [Pseudooceanicola pacificus]
MITVNTLQDLLDLKDKTIGPSDWLTVTQEMIDGFAEVTGDTQWIHVDVERAKRESPAGTTIAHGFLLLSLLGKLQPMIFTANARQILNYGIEKLRFLNMVRSGTRIRLSQQIVGIEEAGKGHKTTTRVTIEVEGEERPAIVADLVFLYFF